MEQYLSMSNTNAIPRCVVLVVESRIISAIFSTNPVLFSSAQLSARRSTAAGSVSSVPGRKDEDGRGWITAEVKAKIVVHWVGVKRSVLGWRRGSTFAATDFAADVEEDGISGTLGIILKT